MNTEQELNLTQEKNYERLRDIVIGTGDGLTIPFALAAGLIAKPTHGDKIRFAPPLIISAEQIKECVNIIKESLVVLDTIK